MLRFAPSNFSIRLYTDFISPTLHAWIHTSFLLLFMFFELNENLSKNLVLSSFPNIILIQIFINMKGKIKNSRNL